MFQLTAFLCLCAVSCVLSVPLKNVFASSVESSNEGPHSGQGSFGDFAHASFQALPDLTAGHFYVPSTTSATYQLAAKEYDPVFSQIVSVYDHSQNKANGFINAKPIVDQIKEEDKYGNNGDQFAGVGRAIVNGLEGASNFVNKLFEAPRNGQRWIGKGVTEQLNKVGAKLVGL